MIGELVKDLRELADAMSASTNLHTINRVAQLRAQADAVEALQADADRYRGLRRVAMVDDEAKQDAVDTAMTQAIVRGADGPRTPEAFDAAIDAGLLACAELLK